MQSNHDRTLDLAVPAAPHTTAAGLEAWLSGTHAGENSSPTQNGSENVAVGPVNAAEALALSLVQGTFSSPRKLAGTDGAELVVDPERDVYHFESTSLKPLAPLLQQSASAWSPVYSQAVAAARTGNPAQPLERLRWYAGLIATPGILSRKLSRSERYRLSRWPETDREFPRHFRIAKEMLKEVVTIDEIVAASGMPYEEVVDYINASHACGRLETASTAQGSETASIPSRRERLIARLGKPLFTR